VVTPPGSERLVWQVDSRQAVPESRRTATCIARIVSRASGVKVQRNTPVSPNLRAHVEWFIQSQKPVFLDKFVIVGERHLNHVNRDWRLQYNRERPHEACGHLPPGMGTQPEANETVRMNDVVYS
jgi:putative transposase